MSFLYKNTLSSCIYQKKVVHLPPILCIGMKRLMIIVCSWMLFIMGARGQDPFNPEGLTGSAGKEFYFAIFNHWLCTSDSNRNFVELMFHSLNPTDIDVALPDGSTRKWHIDSNTYQRQVLTHKEISPYTPVHVTSSSPCYLSVWVHGQRGVAAPSTSYLNAV